MNFLAILSHIRIKDAVDILFLTAVAYHLYLWFQGTKAFRALVGLLALGIIYTAAQLWGLFLTTWMFQILWQVLIILLIILFQSEIRQVLERMNPLQAFGWRRRSQPISAIRSFSETCFLLAKRKIGALIILERTDRIDELITGGFHLEGEPGTELLLSIFQKESPLHDGAVLIREDRVVRAGAYLPLSSSDGLPHTWGTRHRAALGLSERSDAWVVVISEERSEVSLVRAAKVQRVETPEALFAIVSEALRPPVVHQTLLDRLRSLIAERWRVKLGTLAFVSALWLVFAGQQNFEVTLQIPVQVVNLPARMEILQPLNPHIKATIRGLRKDASTIQADEITAGLDLAMAGLGQTRFRITPDQILLPNAQVHVVRVDPSEMTFEFKPKPVDPAAVPGP